MLIAEVRQNLHLNLKRYAYEFTEFQWIRQGVIRANDVLFDVLMHDISGLRHLVKGSGNSCC